MAIDQNVFKKQFNGFKERVASKSGKPFVSFHEGLALEWEGYKEPLRQKALGRLKAMTWEQSAIGKGVILAHLISAIEIPIEGKEGRNNLVEWTGRYGPNSKSHRVLLEAQASAELCQTFEMWAFEFYRNISEPEAAFETLRSIVGNRYDIVAYLFFLKDLQIYMPISTEAFDEAFKELTLDVKTSGKCSWANYQDYLHALSDTRAALSGISGLSDVKLVDAHSFCWLLVRLGPDVPVETTSLDRLALDDLIRSVTAPLKPSKTGQGWGLTGPLRKLVEYTAMAKAKQWLKDEGFEFEDVSSKESCDFRAQKLGDEWIVEVKGTTGGPDSVLLTANEVALHRKIHPLNVLLIVHGIKLSQDGTSVLDDGELMVIKPWGIVEELLKPICYEYRLPQSD